MAVARSSSGGVTKSQGEGAILGVFLPTDNALYSIPFGTYTKTAEPIEMPFGMTRVGPMNHVLNRGADPPKEVVIFSGVVRAIQKHWQSSLQRSLQRRCGVCCKRIIQSPITPFSRSDQSLRQASTNIILKIYGRRRCGLSAAKGVVELHSAGEV